MDVDADRLTEILAGRLAAIVPDGFHVRASDGMLWYSGEPGRFPGQLSDYQAGTAGTFLRDNLEARGEITEERLTAVVAQALDELQDYVDEASQIRGPGPGLRRGRSRKSAARCFTRGTAGRTSPARQYSPARPYRSPRSSARPDRGAAEEVDLRGAQPR